MATDRQKEFFLNSRSDVVELELFEILHPNFTKTHRFVRNAVEGITLPNGDLFRYYPAKVSVLSTSDNMDYGIKCQLGDLSQVLPPEVSALQKADNLKTNPTVNYYVYRHDDLSDPLEAIEKLELSDFSFNKVSSFFTAGAPVINKTKTGTPFNVEDFSSLEGFLT